MQKKNNFSLYFIVFIVLSLLVFAIASVGFLKPIGSFFQGILAPVQSNLHKAFIINSSGDLKALQNENLELKQKLVDQAKIVADNKALRDQFQTADLKTTNLIPAQVIGAPGFLPGVSVPDGLVLNKGEADGVKIGAAVVYKNNLIGKVIKISAHFANVNLITNQSISFTAKTLTTQSAGVVKGEGGEGMILDNVLLSDKLQNKDLVVTAKDLDQKGNGFPPDLIVGQVQSISKNASDLFQKAEIKSLLDFSKLDLVFVISNL